MPAHPKPITYRSEKYKAFISEEPCVVPGCNTQGSDPHHTGGIRSGRGKDHPGSDYECVPLCRVHHVALHTMGRSTFAGKFDVDVREEIIYLLQKYIAAVEAERAIK